MYLERMRGGLFLFLSKQRDVFAAVLSFLPAPAKNVPRLTEMFFKKKRFVVHVHVEAILVFPEGVCVDIFVYFLFSSRGFARGAYCASNTRAASRTSVLCWNFKGIIGCKCTRV